MLFFCFLRVLSVTFKVKFVILKIQNMSKPKNDIDIKTKSATVRENRSVVSFEFTCQNKSKIRRTMAEKITHMRQ